MDELIKRLREHADWIDAHQFYGPADLSRNIRDAADELEKRRWMPENAERVKELVLSKLKENADDYYASGYMESYYVADYCFSITQELLDELDAKLEAPKEDKP